MSQSDEEKRVYKDSEPVFYDHFESLLEASVSEVVIEDKTCNVAKDKTEYWIYPGTRGLEACS